MIFNNVHAVPVCVILQGAPLCSNGGPTRNTLKVREPLLKLPVRNNDPELDHLLSPPSKLKIRHLI